MERRRRAAVRTPLELLMGGKRAGLAADALSIMWSSRAAQLAMAQSQSPAGPAAGRLPVLVAQPRTGAR